MIRIAWSAVAWTMLMGGPCGLDAAQPAPNEGAPATQGQQPGVVAAALPDGRQLFARYLDAIGGREAFRSHTNRRSRGTLTAEPEGKFGLYTIWQVAPDKRESRLEMPGQRPVTTTYDGEYGWTIRTDSNGGEVAELIRNETLFDLADASDFYFFDRIDERLSEATTLREETVDGKPFYLVHVTYDHGREAVFRFSAESGLLSAIETVQGARGGAVIKAEVHFGDYRDVSGVLVPFVTVQRYFRPIAAERPELGESPPTEFELIAAVSIKLDEITANAPGEPTFQQPKQIADLIRRLEERAAQPDAGG
ncbi:MAG: hypothetical protein H6811_05620 [Phycisphaeraceae bacterium]|nr:hypothetical protein [Phycisphaeraceae bacterium]